MQHNNTETNRRRPQQSSSAYGRYDPHAEVLSLDERVKISQSQLDSIRKQLAEWDQAQSCFRCQLDNKLI